MSRDLRWSRELGLCWVCGAIESCATERCGDAITVSLCSDCACDASVTVGMVGTPVPRRTAGDSDE